MELLRAYRPVVADSRHFDENQGADPYLNEQLDPDPHASDIESAILPLAAGCFLFFFIFIARAG
jgi:hypothetical protein